MHKAFHDELPQVLSDSVVMKRPTVWNISISKEKTDFSNTSYKNLTGKIPSLDIFKELTFKETSTSRRKDFNYI